MKKEYRIKTTKLVAICLTLAFIGWQIAGENASARHAAQTTTDRPEIIGIGASMPERLGSDDGASLVVHFSGDIHGSLEPCG
jgi:hypothetical protein